MRLFEFEEDSSIVSEESKKISKKKERKMYESGEDYLEAILRLQLENGFVRSVDIAHKLGVSRPSVSRAMNLLEKDGYIEFSMGNMIKLTDKGMAVARDIFGRHKLLTAFLQKITGVPEDQAEENACRVEHDIDADVVAGIQKWMADNAVEMAEQIRVPDMSEKTEK